MDCSTFQDCLSDYVEGSAGRRRAALASHLFGCQSCRALYDDIRSGMSLCRDLGETEAPTDLPERILATTSAGAMMSCSVFDEWISDYFDNRESTTRRGG